MPRHVSGAKPACIAGLALAAAGFGVAVFLFGLACPGSQQRSGG